VKLAEMQQLFWDLLQGLDRPYDAFVGTTELPAGERVAIYVRMVLHRQVDALRETFPKVVAALGDEAFFETAVAYVRAHPSENPDLGQLGRKFATFLDRGDLRDLAALEWAGSEVFEAASAEPLGEEQFAAIAHDPGAFMRRALRLIPGLRLLELQHDVDELWDGSAKAGAPRANHVVVWRKGFEVFHARVDEDESRALRLAVEGAATGDVCGAFVEPQRAFQALQSWLAEGFIATS
jgi:hypothetical protein